MHPYVYCSTVCNSQDMEQPKCPLTEEWITKMWYIYSMDKEGMVHIFNGILLSHKKE